jgi:hypothetical protein
MLAEETEGYRLTERPASHPGGCHMCRVEGPAVSVDTAFVIAAALQGGSRWALGSA